MAIVTQRAGTSMNFDRITVNDIELRGNIINATGSSFRISYRTGDYDDFTGSGFTYNASGKPISGVITGISFTQSNVTKLTITDISPNVLTIQQMLRFIDTNDAAGYAKQIASGADTIIGGPAADVIRGQAGDDTITGGGGNDLIDGGFGGDTVVYSGNYQQYSISQNADGGIKVVDNRTGSPDGTDTLYAVEYLRFADQTVAAFTTAPGRITATAYTNILHASDTSAAAVDLSAKVAAGTLTQAQALTQIIASAANTTSVATLAYEFFTGAIPTSGGYDFLVSPTGPNTNNLNSAYYQSFNVENRYINFAVNLGKNGEGKANFTDAYGSLSLFDATKKAYTTIFGGTPTDTKVTALLAGGRDAYFAFYGQDGLNGLGTKAAMVGWLLAEAVKADVGVYAKANTAFLTDLADGAIYNVPLVGAYGSADNAYSG